MPEEFKKNESYDQNEINELISIYHMALDADDNDTVQEVFTRIYQHIEKFVYKTLWNNYRTLMRNSSHREDLKQEVWLRIFKELKNYDPDKGALTTFVAPWIRHVVADYASKNFSNTTVYFANAMQKVSGAQNFCKSMGINSNDMDVLIRLTGLSDVTIKHALNLIEKKDCISYEALINVGADYFSDIKGPEESVIEAESELELQELCESTLNEKERQIFHILINPDNTNKRHSSYREMMEQFPGSNIPQLKKEVSRLLTKLKTNKKFNQLYPYIAIQERALEENYLPILDSDDRDEVDRMFDNFMKDIDIPEENDPQVKKIEIQKAAQK